MSDPAGSEPIVTIEVWPIDDLVPNERNARVHDAEQIAHADVRCITYLRPSCLSLGAHLQHRRTYDEPHDRTEYRGVLLPGA